MLRNLFSEFKEFALKGNMLDMAIGIIIGASFGKVVDSFVKDIIMPPIGLLVGKVDFADLYFQMFPFNKHYSSLIEAKQAGAVVISYGAFLNNVISFIVVAISVFILIKSINSLKNRLKQEKCIEEASLEKECPYCYSKISIKAVKCPYCTSDLIS